MFYLVLLVLLIVAAVIGLVMYLDNSSSNNRHDYSEGHKSPGLFEWMMTPEYKRVGIRGEIKASNAISSVMRPDDRLFTNVSINYNGRPAELDNVIVNKYGVFVIKVKNYAGAIYGNEDVKLGDMVGLKNIQEIENFDALPKNIQEFLQENNKRNSFIVDHYVKNKEKYGKTIVFAINKTNAFALNALFRKNKIRSDYIVSDVRDAALGITISSKENEEKIKQYRDGKLDVLINVNILTEGTDLPQTHIVFLTRPTISRVFMTQMVGRALRGEKAGGTTDAYIVPFIDDWNGKIAWVNPQSLFKDEYEPQELPTFERKGFSAVEWGGMAYSER